MRPALFIQDYSPRSFVLRGRCPEDTRKRSADLKSLGGTFNARLREPGSGDIRFAGWIFKSSARSSVQEYVDTQNQMEMTVTEGDCNLAQHLYGDIMSEEYDDLDDSDYEDIGSGEDSDGTLSSDSEEDPYENDHEKVSSETQDKRDNHSIEKSTQTTPPLFGLAFQDDRVWTVQCYPTAQVPRKRRRRYDDTDVGAHDRNQRASRWPLHLSLVYSCLVTLAAIYLWDPSFRWVTRALESPRPSEPPACWMGSDYGVQLVPGIPGPDYGAQHSQ